MTLHRLLPVSLALVPLTLLLGCLPAVEVTTIPPDATPGADDSGTAVNDDSEDPVVLLASGTWELDDGDVVSDPCGWNEVLAEYVSLTIFDFLPETFDVEAEEGAFRIKAQNYGAQDYIDCPIVDGEFACSLQTVAAQQLVSGWPTYWTYEIDFRGSVIDDETLVGRASVEFPEINPWDDYSLQGNGVDHEDCGQVYDLTLVAKD